MSTEWDEYGAGDPLLRELVKLAVEGTSLPVTLSVGGALVCGRVIPRQEYMRLLSAWLPRTVGPQHERLDNWLDALVRHGATPEPTPGFIHLKDAYFLASDGSRVPTDSGTLWRGRLARIDGFTFGVYYATPQMD
ncbi:gas vesicle protein [Chitiniphilus shinanonensis]|uniref:Gas vesicle protein n=1 Tax=Chitiniphilus shinanonensis TaxID=553088 RepID=A0ABQ6BUR3_9NEIS|nr:hypothetical protein [Chitiniphilus shinanonensis]GLS05224.1 gas vesicle protein [Chitiniphilus shinanonensis]